MGKAVASSFVIAVIAILAASFFAPRSDASAASTCSPAYGVNACVAKLSTAQASTARF